MADKTGISWTDATWNPVRGCSRVSEGCRNCYAEQQAARIVRMGKGKPTPYDGLVKLVGGEPRWTGKVALDPKTLAWPLRKKKPLRIFVNSMSDLFHESLTNEQIAAVFGVMAASWWHTHQVLTKRGGRMCKWFAWAWEAGGGCVPGVLAFVLEAAAKVFAEHGIEIPKCALPPKPITWPLLNVWLGVSVENQDAADERIPELLRTPAAARFLSCEPLLGPVTLPTVYVFDAEPQKTFPRINWIIAGCESGPGARPCSAEWLRSLRDQCAAADVAFFLKQAVEDGTIFGDMEGECTVLAGAGSKRKAGGVIELPYLDGVQHAAMPMAKEQSK